MSPSHYELDISLPKFKVEFGAKDMNDSLKALGLREAFEESPPQNNFAVMVPNAPQPVYIQKVVHKAVVTVDEEGTVAAAATAVAMGMRCMPQPPQKFTFCADRPFVFCIQDIPTGVLLFCGAIEAPEFKEG